MNEKDYKNPILISVIVPVYNVSDYLDQCVNSIINQTYSNLQIILVDDGSTDNSGKKCDYYAERDNRILVIHQKNQGLSAARNTGLKYVKGEWVSYIDSDDWVDTTFYERFIEMINGDDELDLVMCPYKVVTEENDVTGKKSDNCILFTGHELLEAYIIRNKDALITPAVWDRLYRRDLIQGIEFATGRLSEDTSYTIEVFEKSKKSLFFDCEQYFYRAKREGNISTNRVDRKRIEDQLYHIHRITKYLESHDCEYLSKVYGVSSCVGLAEWLYDLDKPEDRKVVKEYLRCNQRNAFMLLFKKEFKLKRKILYLMAVFTPRLMVRVLGEQ